jgi:8-oxo-dGTP diphosphatase
MMYYTLGFLFSPDYNRVLLIKKNTPVWQAGKLNGIGGKLEPDEFAPYCMVREFKEETGLLITEWSLIAQMKGLWGRVFVYSATSLYIDDFTSPTDEKVDIYRVNDFAQLPVIENLKFLVPLAANTDPYLIKPVYIEYKD